MQDLAGGAGPRPRDAPRPQVVVVGAGFAGLTVARGLRRAPVSVLLLDRHNYHLFTPLLYQVASALLNPSEIAQPIRKLIRPLANCRFQLAEVTGFDLEQRLVETESGSIPYDFLVVAAGSVSNYFGNPSLAQRSLALKSLPDALALRNWVLERFEVAGAEPDLDRRRGLLEFTVVGGGPTGVEYAGALGELIQLVRRRDFARQRLEPARVRLIEGADALLLDFAPRLRRVAARALQRRGVELLLKTPVLSLEPQEVVLADGRRLDSQSVIWTAGVRGSRLGERLGVELDRQGRVPVSARLQLAGHPEVMVVGDLAQPGAMPMLAQVAIQQGRRAAANIDAMVRGAPTRSFHYHDLGIMATIGRNQAVAQLGRVRLSGLPGWLLWLVVHLINILTFRARLATLLNWAWDYLARDRPIRLVLRAHEFEPDPEAPGASPGESIGDT